jgi:hypothetical protein
MNITTDDIDAIISAVHKNADKKDITDLLLDLRLQLTKN